MARIVKHEDIRPVQIKEEDVGRWFCMCGLSAKKPFCDGSHKSCKDEEGKVYEYKDGERTEVKE